MTKPSNLYAEKIYAENPIALWALDDKADYISLFDKTTQTMSNWTVVGGTTTVIAPTNFALQIDDAPSIRVSVVGQDEITLTSPTIANFSNLDIERDSFNFGFFFNPRTPNVISLEMGYKYDTEVGGNTVTTTVSETFTSFIENDWIFLNKTFKIPKNGNSYLNNTFRTFIQIRTSSSANFEYYINGLSLGQWSEAHHTESIGTTLIDLPSSIALPATKAVEASAYGVGFNQGYYLAAANRLYAYNDGFPIVYGASNLTKVIKNPSGGPSLIVPGLGFLNESGRYRDYTFEMWLRVVPETETARRIFGPISNTDGLYVNGKFLTLKVGSLSKSHYVGEWGRPMLIQIVTDSARFGVLLNGETVIDMPVDKSTISLAAEKSNTNKDQDWLGFYAYDDIPFLELDCVATYSYPTVDVVAKRRFVYGQGVEFPEITNATFGGNAAVVDYAVAGYANNYLFPDMGRWGQGIRDNLFTDNSILSIPDYQLPTVVFENNESTEDWLAACKSASDTQGESLVNLSLANSEGYMLFERYNPLSQSLKSLYGVFKTTTDQSKQILFKIENSLSGNALTVAIQSGTISYTFSSSVTQDIVISDTTVMPNNTKFAVGIDVTKFASTYGGLISSFFSAPKNLKLYVGGYKDFDNTFSGNIYSIGFTTSRNHESIASLFNASGYFVTTAISSLQSHVASYTLLPQTYLSSFVLGISSDAYWQDYVPLTYFGKNVTNKYGETVYGLDYLQLNVDVPAFRIFADDEYDTSDSSIRTYISFQPISGGANRSSKAFTFTENMPADGVIIPEGNEWLNTKYEFVNDSVVYMPSTADFRTLAIVFHFELKAKMVNVNPIKIRSLQIASQVLNKNRATPIKTKFNIDLVPYVKVGAYEDYEDQNPISISKESLPYLYLTETSGIRLRGSLANQLIADRGIRMTINPQKIDSYSVGAIQVLSKYTDKLFPTTRTEIFKIDSSNYKLSAYVQADNAQRTRGRVIVVNTETGLEQQAVTLYLNGVPTKSLYINSNQWNMIGLQFTNALRFDNRSGSLSITGPMLFNHIAEYRLTADQIANSFIFRTWGQVLTMDLSANNRTDNPLTPDVDESQNIWRDFINSSPTISWENVLFIPAARVYLLDPASIYRLFAGTNKVIVNNTKTIGIGSYKYSVFKNVSWSSSLLSPV